jgi:hypothetical protein
MFEDVADALELERRGLAVVSVRKGFDNGRSTGLIWVARKTTKAERRRAYVAAQAAAQKAAQKAKRASMTRFEKAIEAASKDGYRVANKGIGYTLKPNTATHGQFAARRNERQINRLAARFVAGWPPSFESDLLEAWLESYGIGVYEACQAASY